MAFGTQDILDITYTATNIQIAQVALSVTCPGLKRRSWGGCWSPECQGVASAALSGRL
jgi:hypothetical protein